MPLIEISITGLTSAEKLRLARKVQKAFEEEFKKIKGIIPRSWVLVREYDSESLLIDGLTIAEIRAKRQVK